MAVVLEPKTVMRAEAGGALLFQQEFAEACLLSESGLLALRAFLCGQPTRADGFERYLLDRRFVCVNGSVESRQQAAAIDKIIDEAKQLKAPPRSLVAPENIHVYTSNVCDQDCLGCYYSVSASGPKQFIARELFSKIVADARRVKVFQIALGGGEPLLHPRIAEMIQEVSDSGIVATLTSNGNRLDRDMATQLRRSGLSKIQISLNGDGVEMNSLTRPNFDNAVSAIENAVSAGIRAGINFVVTKRNLERIPKMLSMADHLGCATFNILRPKEALRDADWLAKESLQRADYVWLRNQLRRDNKRFRTEIKIDDALSFLLLDGEPEEMQGNGVWGCIAARRFLNIDPFGNVFACSHVRESDVGDGDFVRAWHESQVFRRFRETVERVRGKCASCRYKICCSGCRAVVLGLGGDFFDEDSQCPITD